MDLQASVTEYLPSKPTLTPHMSVGAGVMFRFVTKWPNCTAQSGLPANGIHKGPCKFESPCCSHGLIAIYTCCEP